MLQSAQYTTCCVNAMLTPEIVITSIVLFFYSLLLVLSVLRLRSKDILVMYLTMYIGLGMLGSLSQLMMSLRVASLPGITFYNFTQLLLLTMVLVFGFLTLGFLKKGRNPLTGYVVVSLLIVAIWSLFAFNLGNIGNLITGVAGDVIATTWAGIGWIIAIATAFVSLGQEFRQRLASKYLNRLRYWLIATTLLGTGGLVLFFSPPTLRWSALPLTLAANILVSYIILTYHTADLSRLIGRALHYVSLTGTIAVIYFLSLASAVIVSRNTTDTVNVFFWAVILSVLLAVVTPPLWHIISRLFTRVVFGNRYRDERQIIRHYSRTISAALDMTRLGDIVINLMIETLGIEQGAVFVNEKGDASRVSLRPLSSVGMRNVAPGSFSIDSLFIDHFRKGNKTLHQYDIDVLPEFSELSGTEKSWLDDLQAELFVPIQRYQDMVGLLAFGPRTQGTAYYEEDIDLMVALADQAAMAMDSARLFEQLATINQEVGLLSEELAGLDQNKTDFLSIASHELRTPLTHIHGYSRMLLDLTEEEAQDTSYVRTIVEGIVKGSDRMKSVIDMMFDVTEANVGEMSLFLGPVDLSEVLDQAVRPYIGALDERRIAFGKDGFEDLPVVEADGTRLVQALENLIGNAIKYTPDGGLVTVEAQAVVVDKLGSAVQIVVTDTGIGIDPEHHEKIFEKFFRVDDTAHHSTGKTKFKGAGPGLGLTLVRGIADAHGGKVWLESLGHDETNLPGSKFFFILPLHPVIQALDTRKQSQIETVQWRNKDRKEKKDQVDNIDEAIAVTEAINDTSDHEDSEDDNDINPVHD